MTKLALLVLVPGTVLLALAIDVTREGRARSGGASLDNFVRAHQN
jgi:hypothetical protein